MQLCNQSLNRWLSLRLEFVGALVALAAAALAIEQSGHAAWAGLTLSYALQMTSLTTMTVCSFSCACWRMGPCAAGTVDALDMLRRS
jgi:hypothetical protein